MQRNNPLLNRYQQSSRPVQNNLLNTQDPRKQMLLQQQQQMMEKIKQEQESKKIERLHKLEKTYNQDKLRDTLIQPLKVREKNNDIGRVYKSAVDKYGLEVNDYQKKRTNEPYKVILKGIVLKEEDYRKDYKDPNTLIVHKTTKEDKDKRVIETSYQNFSSNIKEQNNELKKIYSDTNQSMHKEKFEYNNKHLYRAKHDPSDHTSLKKGRISFYKKEQQLMEDGKEKLDNIIESLISAGMMDEKTDNTSNKSNDSGDKYDKYRQRQKK